MQSRDVLLEDLSKAVEVEPVGKLQCLRIARECMLDDPAGRYKTPCIREADGNRKNLGGICGGYAGQ